MHKQYIQAGNPETPVAELKELVADSSSRVRRRVAENPATPEELLQILSTDSDHEVRIAVARNPQAPRFVLEKLADDDSVAVRFGLASAHDLPLYILEKLSQDDHPYVNSRAQRTLEGLFLEAALKEISFVHQPQEEAKLGEILIKAEILTSEQVNQYIDSAKSNGLPLGRTLVQARALPRAVIVMALQAQLQIRRKVQTIDNAIKELKTKVHNSQILNSTGFIAARG